jgi:hypothetical protein
MPRTRDRRDLEVRAPRTLRRLRVVALLTLVLVAAAAGGLVACGSSTAPKPKIAFAPTSLTLTAVAGATASGSVAVKNQTGGTLSGLTATVAAYSTGGSGWLSATLLSATGPTSLQLVADATTLTPGSYTAVVNVSSAVASPPTATLTVTFVVTH